MSAAARGDVDSIRALLAAGAEIDRADTPFGRTALMYAVMNGHPPAVQLLIERGAAIEARDRAGWSALGIGAQNVRTDVVRVLLSSGAKVDVKSYEGYTPLIVAARNSNLEVVRLLLAAGADPHAVAGGRTALEWARHRDNQQVADLLATGAAPPP